jgi:hypothetical protein
MAVQEGSKVLFSRAGRVFEGRVFAVHGGACSVEVTTRRAFYLERWEILLDLGVDREYLAWLLDGDREVPDVSPDPAWSGSGDGRQPFPLENHST